jgi:hypothetical protein
MKKKRWEIRISQNYWEYYGTAFIKAKNVIQAENSNKSVWADGVYIEFDEEIKIID